MTTRSGKSPTNGGQTLLAKAPRSETSARDAYCRHPGTTLRWSRWESRAISDAFDAFGNRVQGIAWTHRQTPEADIYFISNQQRDPRDDECVAAGATGRMPELWDPVTGEMHRANSWRVEDGRTVVPLRLEASGSIFVVLREATANQGQDAGRNWLDLQAATTFDGPWRVTFDPRNGGPDEPVVFDRLEDWTCATEPASVTIPARSATNALLPGNRAASTSAVWLDLGRVKNLAEVWVNGQPCGIAWTAPYRVEMTQALRPGENDLRIDVTNTWANRLIGDHDLPEDQRVTWTTAPYRLAGKPLLDAGLLGSVALMMEVTEQTPRSSPLPLR